MDQRPPQPPEGKLIADAADRLDLSIREAARLAGLSYGRWRQITSGYQNVSPGSYAAVRAPARTLAKMARVVGLTPQQMETEGQRPDAAEAMRQDAEARVPPRLAAVPPSIERGEDDIFPDMDADMRARVEARVPAIEALVRSAAIDGPLTSGNLIFRDPHEAEMWDRLVEVGQDMRPGQGYSLWQLIRLMAVGRIRAGERHAGNPPARVREVLTSPP